jgi:hypothetical protein
MGFYLEFCSSSARKAVTLIVKVAKAGGAHHMIFGDNSSTYFIGYKTHNKINQLKGDQICVILRCRAWFWFRMVIARYCFTPDHVCKVML